MVFSYNWLQSFFQKKLPLPEKLAQTLTMHFAEVEEIKKKGNDFILNIDVRPNRAADCFSHLGIAREIAAITNLKLKIQNSELLEDKKLKAKDFVSLEVRNKTACPRYTAAVIDKVKVSASPTWLKDRLSVCGLKPINNIVDIANYVMLETGQPLHAFDSQKLKGNKIIVRFAKNREKIVTLDEEKHDLDEDILVISDDESPVAVAGIKGGKLPEITKETKTIILESANFDSLVIRRASQKLNLKTDASLRFEHGLDPNLTEFAVRRAAFLIQKIAGGKKAKDLIDFYPKKYLPKTIKLDLGCFEKLLGSKIPEKKIRSILEILDFKVKNLKPGLMNVEVPTRRLDVFFPEDLIEEVGRIYGYDKIDSVFPVSSLIPAPKNLKTFWENMAKDILKEAGFTEVNNYSFFGKKEAAIFGHKEKELIGLKNPLSQEHEYLRSSLIPGLLKNAEKNIVHCQRIEIFELGKIFKFPSIEKRHLSGLIMAKKEATSAVFKAGEEFYYLKGVIDLFLQKLGIANIWYDEYQATPEDSKKLVWHPRKCAEIKVNGQEIGFLGEVSPKIMSFLEIKEKAVLFDIDFEKLCQMVSAEHEYRPISRFPSAVRDIAILVPRKIKVSQVLNKIYVAGGEMIRNVDLFDIYEGEEMPQGKKNLAFHIIYQAKNRTLSSEEIDKLQNKIIKNLEKQPEWQVRK